MSIGVLRLLVRCAHLYAVPFSVLYIYSCVKYSIVYGSHYCNVTCIEVVPVLLGSSALPDVTLVKMENDVTLQCPQIITYPTPTLMWLANGSVVLENVVNYTFNADDTAEGIYQCLVEASFTPTTNRAGLPPAINFVTTTFVDVFCKCVSVSTCSMYAGV